MKHKSLLLGAVAVMLTAALAIGGTIAYFSDETETKTNTFTVGKVDITLTEPAWDENADHTLMPSTSYAKDPTITVSQDSQPSWVFMKVSMNKFNSWLRLACIMNDESPAVGGLNLIDYDNCSADCQGHFNTEGLTALFSDSRYQAVLDQWFGGIDHSAWKVMNLDELRDTLIASWSDPSIKTLDAIIGYKTVLTASQSVTLFDSVTMPADVTSEQLSDSRFNSDSASWKLNVTGYAVQAEGVETLDAAYAALFS